ncbi:MAG: hypothetical protein WBF81_06000 [Thermoplasmata archaeon]
MRQWAPALGAFFVLAIFVLSATVGALNVASPADASPPTASAGALPLLAEAPTSLRISLTPPAPLNATEEAAVSNASALLAEGRAPTVSDLLVAVAATDPAASAVVAATPASVFSAALEPLTCLSCAETVGVGSFAVALVVCGVGGVESIGLACLAALGAASIATAVEYFIGASNVRQYSPAETTFGEAVITDVQQKDQLVEGAWQSELSALNDTLNALAYEAASAVLASPNGEPQIANTSWSPYLDAVQSGVASQLSSVASGYGLGLAAIEAEALNTFDVTFGTGDDSGFGCPLMEDGGSVFFGTATSPGDDCGGTTVGPTNTAYGNVLGQYATSLSTITSQPHSETVYIQGGTTVSEEFGTQDSIPAQLTAYNYLTGHYRNLTTTGFYVNANDTNWTTGVWLFNITGASSGPAAAGANLLFTDGFPLTNDTLTEQTQNEPLGLYTNGAASIVGLTPPPTFDLPVGNGCVEAGSGACAPGCGTDEYQYNAYSYCLGGLTQASAQIYKWLYTLEYDAVTVGKTYWTFLHLQGYYSVSAIPARCVIPLPNMVIPSDIPPNELATANVTNMLNLYLAYLAALGEDFIGPSFSLSTATFCAHGLPSPVGNTTVGFSVYGLGYIYLPGETGNANGTAPQTFSTGGVPQETTWNASGEIFLAPSLFATTPAINTSWELGGGNPAWAYVVPLVSNITTGFNHTVADGPTTCVVSAKNCQLGNLEAYILPSLVGNSSHPGGQAYTSAIGNTTAGAAVYFVACYSASPASVFDDPVYTKGACTFNVSTIVGNGGPCANGGVVSPNGATCNGAPPGPQTAPSSTCGGSVPFLSNIVNALAGAFGSLFGFGCALAWLVGAVFVVIIVVIVVAICVAAVRVVSGSRKDDD